MTWSVISITLSADHDGPCACSHGFGRIHPAPFVANWRLDRDGPTGPVYPKAVCLNRACVIAQEYHLTPWPFGPGQTEARGNTGKISAK